MLPRLLLAALIGFAPLAAQAATDDEDNDFEFDADPDATLAADANKVEFEANIDEPPDDMADFTKMDTSTLDSTGFSTGAPPEDSGFEDPPEDEPSDAFDMPQDIDPPASVVSPPVGLGLDFSGKKPLEDNFPLRIVARDLDAVVVELPVLIARTRNDFGGAEFWIGAEVLVDGETVSETRQRVSSAALADLGPTVIWVKAGAPVHRAKGTVEVKVSRIGSDGASTPLFSRSASYSL